MNQTDVLNLMRSGYMLVNYDIVLTAHFHLRAQFVVVLQQLFLAIYIQRVLRELTMHVLKEI